MDTASRTDVWRCHGRATSRTRRHVDLARVSSALCR
ncbi:putative leader peptide [Actinomycetospora sp. TBRC 11914]